MRHLILLLFCSLLAATLQARSKDGDTEKSEQKQPDKMAEIAQKHIDALGGVDKVGALKSLKATGVISIGQRTIPFTLFAQAPNRVRTEMESEGHKIIRAYDGKNPPWQLTDNTDPAIPVAMTGDAAKEFAADAEFYDPFFNSEERGFSFKYLGEGKIEDRPCLRVLVSREGTDLMEVHLDKDSYLMVRQVHKRRIGGKREVLMETRFNDFRKVAGVMQPHRVTVLAQGRKLHEMEMEEITPNPDLALLLFNQSAQ